MSDVLEEAVEEQIRNQMAFSVREWLSTNKDKFPQNMVSRHEMTIADEDGEVWKIQLKIWRAEDEFRYLRAKEMNEEQREV